jgi:SAM-dependent methyltransferase
MNVFSRIYQHNEWNGIETRSGPGSHREPTRRVADTIVQLVDWCNIYSVINIGCGEDWWMPDVQADYLGIDVAPEALTVARKNHPNREYKLWDARYALPDPEPDLAIVRDVIQHMSIDDAQMVLDSITDSKARYLLASTYVGAENTDIVTGDAYRPNLEAEPFNLPPALLLIHDGYEYHDGDRLRDPAKMLGLWRL